MPNEYKKSDRLNNLSYAIRGPVFEKAQQLEAMGQKIINLNIGNPAPFGFDVPDEIMHDMILNLRNAQGYSHHLGIFPARKAIMHYTQQIGIKDSTPIYALDVNNTIYTNELTAVTQLAPGNLRLNSPNTISTSVGGIDVYINGGGEIFHDRLITDNLVFDDNVIYAVNNSNIVLDPNGSGTVELKANTYITGDLAVSGNISMSGNLTGLSTLTVGDQTIDTVTINTDFTQSIIPGDDLTYALGADAGDSSARRWSELHAPEWQYIDTGAWPGSGIQPLSVTISDQLTLDGIINKISAAQSNDDVLLLPDTGITRIEATQWQDNNLTNLLNTPLTFASTAGIGYLRFMGTNGIVIPTGTSGERPPSPELGDTRWNITEQYLECFDGSVYIIATGGGEIVTQQFMEDLGFVYSAILG
jgi:hypothetical protein